MMTIIFLNRFFFFYNSSFYIDSNLLIALSCCFPEHWFFTFLLVFRLAWPDITQLSPVQRHQAPALCVPAVPHLVPGQHHARTASLGNF